MSKNSEIMEMGMEEIRNNMKAGTETAGALAKSFDPLLDVAKEIASRELRRVVRTVFSRH